ncbi:MAG: TIGR04282 family arsenosugar biosynthesis glycosyltransferase [Rhodoglobus sp.]
MTTLVLIAKEPLPGKAKTRLHPPLTLEQAAILAAAAIDDTLAAMQSLPATRRILLFEGNRVPARSEDYDVTGQTTGTLDLRLGAIFDECTEPMLLIGMDTPQLTSDDLAPAFGGWPLNGADSDVDAWFGPATDGGFWALGMREPRGDLIRGVEMSQDDTGAAQLARLQEAGLTVGTLLTLTDVDTIDSAREVAGIAPHTLFARTFDQFEQANR